LIGKQDALSLPTDLSGREENAGSEPGNLHEGKLPRFRGLLLCRRCDFCGTRIGFHGEGNNRVIMKCPECQREYVFFQHPE